MSEKEKKQTKTAEVSKPSEVVADRIIAELDRVHVRKARY
jgi:hypothetical protein